jgi:Cu/Ag efflux pump CusA
MAIVIIGGLFTSTLLNLLFMPALYGKLAKTKADKQLECQAV